MSNMRQTVKAFFISASAWGANLPQYILVPLIILLAAVGTAVIVGLLLGIIRLVFGQKAVDFIKNMPKFLNDAAHGKIMSEITN